MRAGAVEERAGSARPLDRAEVEHHGRRHIRARRGPRRGDAADTPQRRPRTPTLAPELSERIISGLNTSIHHRPTSLAPACKEYGILTSRPLSAWLRPHPNFGPWTLDLGLWTLDSGLRDELHRETAEQRANPTIAEELARRGWQESELATRRRSDPGKLAIAARLRSETTLPIKWTAAWVQIGTARGAKSVLHSLAQSQDQRKTAKALKPCAQLEFQFTVDPFPHLRVAREGRAQHVGVVLKLRHRPTNARAIIGELHKGRTPKHQTQVSLRRARVGVEAGSALHIGPELLVGLAVQPRQIPLTAGLDRIFAGKDITRPRPLGCRGIVIRMSRIDSRRRHQTAVKRL